MSAADSFIYASAVFPSLPGEYKLPWSSGTLVVENTGGMAPIPVPGWRPAPTAFLAALPLALSLVPPSLLEEDSYLGELCRKIPLWARLLPVVAHTIPQCWGLVHSEAVTRLQYVHSEPRRDTTNFWACFLLVFLTCSLDWSPIITVAVVIYLMRIQILQHLVPVV